MDIGREEDVVPDGLGRQAGQRARLRERRDRPAPSPASVGATNTSSLSTRSAARNEAASVGPPSSSSERTPSAASARSSSSSGPLRSSSSDPSGSGPRPNASRRGCDDGADVACRQRGSSARTVPIPTATASTDARSSCTRRRLASPETQREPGTVTRPSSVIATL